MMPEELQMIEFKQAKREFGVEKLWLTKPAFFARIDGGKPARTLHDEYWHPHVDQVQYRSFSYTGLLYLSDYGVDFTGGKFAFIDDGGLHNSTVEPQRGRLLLFTSGTHVEMKSRYRMYGRTSVSNARINKVRRTSTRSARSCQVGATS
jgi:hypothetical protein